MVSFDVFQRALDGDATGGNESQHQINAPSSAVKTLLERTHALLTESQIIDPARQSLCRFNDSEIGDPASIIGSCDSKDREIVRLERTLTDLQTANEAKDIELRLARQELLNAKDALTDISGLRDDIKTMKQTLGKDHQAIVYRKDIELFASRKGNEQKDRHMKEKGAQLNETFRQQQHATLELKEAQLNTLKDRLALMERQATPEVGHDTKFAESGNNDHALEVRLLRVKKGRQSSSGVEEEKDAIIEQLRCELAAATKIADDVVNQQAELQRAWDISKKIQNALKEERERHDQTKAHLQEASVELDDNVDRTRNRSDPSGRLPTIEENDQNDQNDKNELEAMFDTAQQDNLRLYMEVENLDKRVRDANARVFAADQEIEALRQQVRLEHAINADMETERPSVVHRVHFQRMEGQLKDSRDELANKEEEVRKLKIMLDEKDQQLAALQKDIEEATKQSEGVHEELERLKQSVSDLETAKERFMQDHEHLAAQRSRHRVSSAEFTSARTSSATLINEHSLSPRLTRPSDDAPPVPVAPMLGSPLVGRLQDRDTSQRHLRTPSDTQRHSVISNDAPPADMRHVKRKSIFGLRDMVKRIVKKDASIQGVLQSPTISDTHWGGSSTKTVNNTKSTTAPQPHSMRKRPLSVQVKPSVVNDDNPMPRPIPRPISAGQHPSVRPRTSTAPTAPVPRRFPSRKELDVEHMRPQTATTPSIPTAALPKAMRPSNPRRSSQPRYYTSATAIDIDSKEDLRLQDARSQSATVLAASLKGLDKQTKHDSGIGVVTEGEKSRLSRLSWGSTANKLKRRSLY